MLAFEAVKLSWLNFVLSASGPAYSTWTSAAVLGRFTEPWHEGGWFHAHPRVRFLMRLVVRRDIEIKRAEGETAALLEWCREWNRNPRTLPSLAGLAGTLAPQQARAARNAAAGNSNKTPVSPAERAEIMAHLRAQGATAARARRKSLAHISGLVADTEHAIRHFSLWRLFCDNEECFGKWELRLLNVDLRTLQPWPRRGELALFAWLVLGAAVAFVGQFVSFLYPFANAAFQAGTHNMLQSTCFVASCAALGIAVLVSPAAVWSFVYGRLLHNRMVGIGLSDVDLVAQAVADYHTPPYVGCLQETVPVPVLPAEVTAEVAGFLTAHDIGLGRLTIAECNAMKRRVAERHSFAIGAGDEDGASSDSSAAEVSDEGAARPRSANDERALLPQGRS